MTSARAPLGLVAAVALGHALLLWAAQTSAPAADATPAMAWTVRLLSPTTTPPSGLKPQGPANVSVASVAPAPAKAHPAPARLAAAARPHSTPAGPSAAPPPPAAVAAQVASVSTASPAAAAPEPGATLAGQPDPVGRPESPAQASPAPGRRAPTQPAQSSRDEPPDPHAAYLNNPAPPYPLLSRRLGEQGTVQLAVWVDAQGLVSEVRLARSSGHPRLDAAAQQAVRGWRFVPGRRNQIAQPMWVNVPLVFRLDEG